MPASPPLHATSSVSDSSRSESTTESTVASTAMLTSVEPAASKIASTTTVKSSVPGFLMDLLQCFRSVHLAIVLIGLLCLATLVGVVMPQEGTVDPAQIQQQYGPNYAFMKQVGLFNVFSSFWFITLEVLFFFSLLIGSFKWLKPAFLAATQVTFIGAPLMTQKPGAHSLANLSEGSPQATMEILRPILKRHGYQVHGQGNEALYATKGHWSRLGPCVAHLGILLCLIAGVYGSFTGFKAIHMVEPGQGFQIPQSTVFQTNTPQPTWFGSIPTWTVYVDRFNIEHYDDHPDIPKNYYSDLRILDAQGKTLKTQQISVNHPLMYDGISIYQASFAPTGKFWVTVAGQPLQVELNKTFNERTISVTPLSNGKTLVMFPFFAAQDPGVTEDHAIFFIMDRQQSMPQGQMPPNIKLKVGESGSLLGVPITYNQPVMSTGLQMKRAPEVPLMYLSYLVIGVGSLMCFFSQRQLWVSLRPVSGPEPSSAAQTEVLLWPKTNKGRLSFQKELLKLEAEFVERLKPTPSLSRTNP